jgi:hypothetical protein
MSKDIKGCIYMIKNRLNDKKYIGSTTQQPYIRYLQHLDEAFKPGKKCKLHEAMNSIGFEYFSIIKMESYEGDLKGLRKKEGEYQRFFKTLENGYNARLECRDPKEYYETYRDKIRAYNNHPFVCECGGRYFRQQTQRHFRTKKHQHHINEQSGKLQTNRFSEGEESQKVCGNIEK